MPACEDRARRERLEADDEEWLRYYFARESGSENPFWYDFTDQQKEMITAIRNAIIYGGDQSIAVIRQGGTDNSRCVPPARASADVRVTITWQ